jgi:hypothetical protein
MAVLIEGISVVVRADAIFEVFPGDWEAFKEIVPNRTLCADGEVARVGFMTPVDVQTFIDRLEENGLTFQTEGRPEHIVVIDQIRGPMTACDWIEFGRVDWDGDGHQVAACRLVDTKVQQVVTPPDWAYEESLTASFGFVPTEHEQKSLQFLRQEDGLDVYLNLLTGREVFVGGNGKA